MLTQTLKVAKFLFDFDTILILYFDIDEQIFILYIGRLILF